MKSRYLKMQTGLLILIYGVAAALMAQQYSPPRVRTVLNLNTGWTFIKNDVAVATATAIANPTGWSAINLPHSFDIPYFRAGKAVAPFIGWYRRHVTVDQQAITAGKRFFIQFDGSFIVTSVYVNGTLVGQHKGGYTGFSYDITNRLQAGDNVIAVRVDGSWQRLVPPRSGEHIFIGGIYRNVSMLVTEPLHVDWYGTFVATPTINPAVVKIKTDVVNSGPTSKSCRVKSIVVDAAMTMVTSMESTQTVAAGATVTFAQTCPSIASPHLWSPASPYLYKVYTEVYDGTTLVDNYVSPLGIRSIQWTADQGFFLNGSHCWLHGADVHQDHAGWGDATTNTGVRRDVQMVKDCGMNFIRGSHYPHHPEFAGACDSLGVCFWSEMCFWSSGGNSGDSTNWAMQCYPGEVSAAQQASFDSSAISQLTEMLRINRNHPSIIVWSMCNEVFFGQYTTQQTALLTKMVAATHQLDSTRLAAIGGCQRNGYDAYGDVSGYNGDGATLYMNPVKPNIVTEYGSCTEDRPGSFNACWGNVQITSDSANQFAWRSGVTLWCAFHHGSNANMGNMGMIDHARLPLERWYYYRQKNLGIAPPTWPSSGTASKLAIITDRAALTDDGTTDAHLIVQIQNSSGTLLANTANITLTDASGLGLFPSVAPAGGTSITFTGNAVDQGVRVGQCAIEYRAYNAGAATITASSNGLTSGTTTIVINHAVDSPIVYPLTGVQERQTAARGPRIMRQERFVGNSVTVPRELRGRECAVALYSLQGKCMKAMYLKGTATSIKIDNAATTAMIARFTTR